MAYGIEQYKDKLWSCTWTSRLSTFVSSKRYKEHILDTAQMFGFKEMTGMDKFFQQLDDTIKKVEKDLDEGVNL